MSFPGNINWLRESVDLLAATYAVRENRGRSKILDQITRLVRKYAHADTVALVHLEDAVTARVVTSYPAPIDAAAYNEYLIGILAEGKYIITKNGADIDSKLTGKYFYLPLRDVHFKGAMVLYWETNFDTNPEFEEFLQHAWTALKGITWLTETHYHIEELSTRFNAIMATTPQGIVFVDDSGKNVWVNKQAAGILGVNDNKNEPLVISAAMANLRSKAVNQADVQREGIKLFSAPNQALLDWRWIFGEPVTLVLSVSCTPVESENIKGRLWAFTDVTSLHVANQQLKVLNIELDEKRKIADEQNKAKSGFLANMSHEIRTPMNGVIGMTSLLIGTPLSEEQQDYVDTIRISGETLLSLINDILDFSKIESGKLELETQPFPLSTVIEETYDLLSIKANEKGLDLLYAIEPDVPSEIIGDITRLRQILVNLVSNGIKFTQKGEILVSVRTVEKVDQLYTIEFAVKDSGIGIPEDKFHRLFQSFSQVDSSTTRKYGGTGLGLAISQRLVEVMDGNIRAESKPGEGSSFIFTIKVEASIQVKQFHKKLTVDEIVLKGKRVLILDDNLTNLRILKKQFEVWEMHPVTFDHYQPALDAIGSQHFDLAILDMLMPEKDGVDVARLIRDTHPYIATPLVLFSSAGYVALSDDNDSKLFAAILNKPVKYEHIRRTLLNVLNKNSKPAEQAGKLVTGIYSKSAAINILVAEDNDINQKLIRRSLEKMGLLSDIVFNGLEVIEAVVKLDYDLIFMDIQMPEMDGYEATRYILENYQDRKRPVIIAMTANALSGDKELALEAGMDDYISKPFKIQDIKEKIDQWFPQLAEQLIS